jgi:hypothetical protein
MIHHQTDYEVILISRYSTVGDLRKRIKQYNGSSDFLLWRSKKSNLPIEEFYEKYQHIIKKRKKSSNHKILDNDERPLWKLGPTEQYTLIINYLDLDPRETSFDRVDESMDEGKIGNFNLLNV